MQRPTLVQRCELADGKLKYDYMGNADFEGGEQAASLKRIFAKGISVVSTTIDCQNKEVTVYTVSGQGFPVADYQPHFQRLAERGVAGEELTDFDEAVKEVAGVNADRTYPRINAWFDLDNDVLWTLSEENQRALVSALEAIKAKWSPPAETVTGIRRANPRPT